MINIPCNENWDGKKMPELHNQRDDFDAANLRLARAWLANPETLAPFELAWALRVIRRIGTPQDRARIDAMGRETA